jgi:hypothetical protein
MIPRPQRTLAEIEAQARQLRDGGPIVSSQAERTAAAGLLSAEMDTSGLTQRLVEFQVEAGAEEQFSPEDAVSVHDYMDAFTRNAINKAMQVCNLSDLVMPKRRMSPFFRSSCAKRVGEGTKPVVPH